MIHLGVTKKDFNLNDSETLSLKDAIELVEKHSLKKNEVVTSIVIEGESYLVEQLDELMEYDITELGEPKFIVKSSYEIAFEALEDSNGYIDLISAKITQIVALYNENKLDDANIVFTDLIDLIDLFIQLISKVHKTVRSYNENFFKDNNTIRDLEIHLLSILKALIPAKEKNDIIMLCDLLEYELADNLAQWKIKAIPLLLKSKVD